MFYTRLPHKLPVSPPLWRTLWPHHNKLPRHDFLCTARNEDKLTSLVVLVAHAGARWPRTAEALNTAIYRKWTMKVRVSTPWIKISCSENMLVSVIQFNFARHLVCEGVRGRAIIASSCSHYYLLSQVQLTNNNIEGHRLKRSFIIPSIVIQWLFFISSRKGRFN